MAPEKAEIGLKLVSGVSRNARLGRISRHVNERAYEVSFAHTDYFEFSYFPRTKSEWNVSPTEAVDVPFSRRL